MVSSPEKRCAVGQGGRKTKLTPQIIEDFARILPTVMYLETVGDYLGVERTTWRKWLKRGATEVARLRKPGEVPNKREELFVQFFNTVKKGKAEGEFCHLTTIRKASEVYWQAASWILERRYPDRWGKKERLDATISGKKDAPPITIVEVVVPKGVESEEGSG